ncbi:proteasome subunit beta type-3-like [Drosophila kikkawai]|uniref:Proteasome subunit beta type-3-like n=1 Tax=Drosophila kikkawai TaxID=30033 RepID=A0A6P4J797_DROKI|nr:proteasome subunit beta type-3-like [Drosophila kikkawai]
MPPWTDNGGCMAAMCGKGCVAIATDYDTGVRELQPTDNGFKKVFKISQRTFVGFTGLQMDILALRDRADNHKQLREGFNNGQMSPQQFSIVVSNLLFKQRSKPYYVEPMVVGLEPDPNTKSLRPYICHMDWIGCRRESNKFAVAGTCAAQLTGMCASMWQPDLSPDDLFQVISTAVLGALDRDPTIPLGVGALVCLIEEHRITERLVDSNLAN